jgi:hypothetical protein
MALNQELLGFGDVLRAQEGRRERTEDVAFRERQQKFTEKAHKQNRQLQQKQEKTNLGTTIAQTGVGLATNPAIQGMQFGQIVPSGLKSSLSSGVSNFDLGGAFTSALTGGGLGMLADNPVGAFGLGALGGGGLQLLTGGLESNFADLGMDALLGGLGGAFMRGIF